jgi:hypothetical protein
VQLKIEPLEERFVLLESENQAHSLGIDSNLKRIKDLDIKHLDLNAISDGIIAGIAAITSSHEGKVAALEVKTVTHDGQIAANIASLASVEADVATNTATIATHSTSLADQLTAINDNTTSITSNAANITTNSNDIVGNVNSIIANVNAINDIKNDYVPSAGATQIDGEKSFLVGLKTDGITERTGSAGVTIGNNTVVNGNLTLNGDFTQNGVSTVVSAQTVEVKNNTIILNEGEPGAGVTPGVAGVIVDRGTEANYLFQYNETKDVFEVGEVGSLQTVATKADSLDNNVEGCVVTYDNVSHTLVALTKAQGYDTFLTKSKFGPVARLVNPALDLFDDMPTVNTSPSNKWINNATSFTYLGTPTISVTIHVEITYKLDTDANYIAFYLVKNGITPTQYGYDYADKKDSYVSFTFVRLMEVSTNDVITLKAVGAGGLNIYAQDCTLSIKTLHS